MMPPLFANDEPSVLRGRQRHLQSPCVADVFAHECLEAGTEKPLPRLDLAYLEGLGCAGRMEARRAGGKRAVAL